MTSRLVNYVGVFHLLREQIRETWSQYRNSRRNQSQSQTSSTPPQIQEGAGVSGGESNFRLNKVKERLAQFTNGIIQRIDHQEEDQDGEEDFSHLKRSKTRKELFQISAAVMGIEFSYAAETAFVSPLLLKMGLRHRHMTMMWCLSPLVGFFLTPLLGSLSDGCRSPLGRRRPFILLLSIGIILGLILVPNGELIGRWLGDRDDTKGPLLAKSHFPLIVDSTSPNVIREASTSSPSFLHLFHQDRVKRDYDIDQDPEGSAGDFNKNKKKKAFYSKYKDLHSFQDKMNRVDQSDSDPDQMKPFLKMLRTSSNSLGKDQDLNKHKNDTDPYHEEDPNSDSPQVRYHAWGLIFTIIGTVLLDFDADACQSPARAYMLDVTLPEDHAKGLSAFTVMAGLGGSLGYVLGGLNWENTLLGKLFGGQVRAVFTLILFIFIGCVVTTIRSFREIPLDRLWQPKKEPGILGVGDNKEQQGGGGLSANTSSFNKASSCPQFGTEEGLEQPQGRVGTYGSTETVSSKTNQPSTTGSGETQVQIHPPTVVEPLPSTQIPPTFKEYVKTILQLPVSLQWLCLTNFFCWMSLVCYSLYFTDFVGEAVFGGDPAAPMGSEGRMMYDSGVRFGCWGMALYSLSCSIYSLSIDGFIAKFGAKKVYITGQIVYSIGMFFMALFRHKVAVILLSTTAGIMYATLFTMPYLLVARYHAAETFDLDLDETDLTSRPQQIRGLGTDVAIISSMVFLAQMTQALALGNVVNLVGSTAAIIYAAGVFAACGAVSATRVLYLDL